MPGIIVGGPFALLVSWSQYILTLMIVGGSIVTLPRLLVNFSVFGRNDRTGAIGVTNVLLGVLIFFADCPPPVGALKFGGRLLAAL